MCGVLSKLDSRAQHGIETCKHSFNLSAKIAAREGGIFIWWLQVLCVERWASVSEFADFGEMWICEEKVSPIAVVERHGW